jgi:hypothetical protein
MVTNELGQQLHDRATRGDALSEEEQRQLNEWYEIQDRAEMEMLSRSWAQRTDESVESLRSQIDAALTQIIKITKRIQEISAENQALRREIATLQRQLAQRTTPQPA